VRDRQVDPETIVGPKHVIFKASTDLQLTVETSMGLKHVISEISTVIQITVETSIGLKHVISDELALATSPVRIYFILTGDLPPGPGGLALEDLGPELAPL
jgi:hypothetical protein